jgi:hypothetical protein
VSPLYAQILEKIWLATTNPTKLKVND